MLKLFPLYIDCHAATSKGLISGSEPSAGARKGANEPGKRIALLNS